MEERQQIIESRSNSKISIGVIPGHFATNHSHINYYIDITYQKTRLSEAQAVAKYLVTKAFFGILKTILF